MFRAPSVTTTYATSPTAQQAMHYVNRIPLMSSTGSTGGVTYGRYPGGGVGIDLNLPYPRVTTPVPSKAPPVTTPTSPIKAHPTSNTSNPSGPYGSGTSAGYKRTYYSTPFTGRSTTVSTTTSSTKKSGTNWLLIGGIVVLVGGGVALFLYSQKKKQQQGGLSGRP